MWILLAVEVLATVADLCFGPWGPRVHWEERFNARAGVQLACGHADAVWAMQYRTFCGGCTAEAVMAAPLFTGFGPTVRVWKLVPVFFHLGITGFGALLARRAVDERAAVAWLLLMIGAPGFYRDLALTGWGNHAESTFFPLAAAGLVVLGRGRVPVQALGGAIAGLGLWFCHTSAHALLALGVLGLMMGRWRVLAAAAAFPVGMIPWYRYHQVDTQAKDWTRDWAGVLDPAPLDELWRWLAGDFMRAGLWPSGVPEVAGRISTDYPELGVVPTVWWGAFWVAALLGGLLGVIAVWRKQAHPAALFGPLALLGLLLAYALRHDLWAETPEDLTFASFNLRYRTPLFPMLALCLTPLVAWRQAGVVVWPVVLGLAGLGAGMRTTQWDEWRSAHDGLSVFLADTRPDRTVPTGQPPQRRVQSQGRPQDVQAALTFLDNHEDPLVECRADHLAETGRRIGLGIEDPAVVALAEAAFARTEGDEDVRWLADGIARGLIDEDGVAPHLDVALVQMSPVVAEAVELAAGRRAYAVVHGSPLRARGACERRAELALSQATAGGEHSPSTWQTEDCIGWDEGIGRGWARFVSCEELPPAGEASWLSACAVYRR